MLGLKHHFYWQNADLKAKATYPLQNTICPPSDTKAQMHKHNPSPYSEIHQCFRRMSTKQTPNLLPIILDTHLPFSLCSILTKNKSSCLPRMEGSSNRNVGSHLLILVILSLLRLNNLNWNTLASRILSNRRLFFCLYTHWNAMDAVPCCYNASKRRGNWFLTLKPFILRILPFKKVIIYILVYFGKI